MQIKVSPSILNGEIRANRSKSYTQRAYAIAALAKGPSLIHYPSWSDDGCAALSIARAMGAEVTPEDTSVAIRPRQQDVVATWSVGESGLSLRMFAPVAAGFEGGIKLSGQGTLLNRPVGMITDTLAQMGVAVVGDRLPLSIKGPISSGEYQIDGSLSSQLITGLLIAMPLLDGDSVLHVKDLKSTPYIDMTLEVMRAYGVVVQQTGYERFEIAGGQEYKGTDYTIEADWSGLAFPLVAGALCGNVRLTEVAPRSLQADRAIIDVLKMAGAQLNIEGDSIMVRKSEMTSFDFDATDCPDLFPPLVILAARCEGISRIRGVHRLTHKESNRADVLRDEFDKLGVQVAISGDEMIIVGFQQVKGGEVNAHGDHRIAMALSVAGFVAQEDVIIYGANSIAKSYPDFYADMSQLRARLSGPESLMDRRTARHFLEEFPEHHK